MCDCQRDANILYQLSTASALFDGVYDGALTYAQLAKYGDFGLGTFNELAGEMLAIDGEFYQINDTGELTRAAPKQLAPFAEVMFFKATQHGSVGEVADYDALAELLLTQFNNKNVPYAIRLDGDFGVVKARNIRRQCRPYRPFVKAAEEQALFDFEEVSGAMVGFWFPDYWSGIAIGGFHLHYVDDERTTGGHVLDLSVSQAELSLAPVHQLHIELPTDAGFAKANLDPAGLREQVKQAE